MAKVGTSNSDRTISPRLQYVVKKHNIVSKLSIFFSGFRTFILVRDTDFSTKLFLFRWISDLFLCISCPFNLCPVYCPLLICVCMLCWFCNWPFGS